MKKSTILIITGLVVAVVSFESYATTIGNRLEVKASEKLEYPAAVKSVIDNKCIGCHNPDSRSEKAKEKLIWANLPGLAKSAQVATLDKIIEVLDKGEMPPKKMVEMHPDKKISEADAKILKDWAKTAADDLMK